MLYVPWWSKHNGLLNDTIKVKKKILKTKRKKDVAPKYFTCGPFTLSISRELTILCSDTNGGPHAINIMLWNQYCLKYLTGQE